MPWLWLLAPWAAWCAWCVLLMLLVPLYHRPRGNAYTNGLVIWMCPTLAGKLTREELRAIYLHERGHVAHLHVWRNLARAWLWRKSTPALEWRQECEADDYAAARGHALHLAGALRKLSPRARDRARGMRLLDAHWANRGTVGACFSASAPRG
jgi:hypothetical protein